MTNAVTLVIGLCALAPVPTAVAGDAHHNIVTIAMNERAGAERRAEWITIGVPLHKENLSLTRFCLGSTLEARIKDIC